MKSKLPLHVSTWSVFLTQSLLYVFDGRMVHFWLAMFTAPFVLWAVSWYYRGS